MVALPDSSGFVTCSADHDVKFWEWQVAEAQSSGSGRQLGARHTRTLKMADDVLCCRVSADGRLLAVALLDSTIQVRMLRSCRAGATGCICWLSRFLVSAFLGPQAAPCTMLSWQPCEPNSHCSARRSSSWTA